jgi:putative toxin-antitoxin system antitoxin component (TIGR02293 family)
MTTPQLIEQLEAGFSIKALKSFESNSGLDVTSLASLIGIPERTLQRRRSSGRLSSYESKRLLRISNIFERALELFEGDADAANALAHNSEESVQWSAAPSVFTH